MQLTKIVAGDNITVSGDGTGSDYQLYRFWFCEEHLSMVSSMLARVAPGR